MIAVLYSLKQEISPMLAYVNVAKEFTIGGVIFYQGDLNGLPLTLVQGGVGRKNAVKAADCLLKSLEVDLLISAGVAGGIRHGLNVGDVVVAERVGYSKQSDYEGDELPLESDFVCKEEVVQLARQLGNGFETRLHFGNLLTVDKVISQASIKRKIGEQTAFLAVEMESAAVAGVACENRIAFAAIRSISDDMDDDLHLDYDNIISDEGKVKVAGVALEVLKNPQTLALLSRLNKQTKKASGSLAFFMSKLLPSVCDKYVN